MGWFDEQIKNRVKKDNELFSDAFVDMSSVVMGSKTLADSLDEQSKQAHDAINVILRFYRITPQEIPVSIKKVCDQLDFLLRPTGIMRRDITLTGKWYKDGIGPLLATTNDDRVIALIPGKTSGYRFFDADVGKYVRVTKKNCTKINPEAICFYKPFPLRKLTVKDLLTYYIETISPSDYAVFLVSRHENIHFAVDRRALCHGDILCTRSALDDILSIVRQILEKDIVFTVIFNNIGLIDGKGAVCGGKCSGRICGNDEDTFSACRFLQRIQLR